jgi:hypothetical protein
MLALLSAVVNTRISALTTRLAMMSLNQFLHDSGRLIISFSHTTAMIHIPLSWTAIKDIVAWAKNRALKPRLELYFDPNKTYQVASDLAFDGVRGMFAHVMIVNHGHKVASKCRGLLSEIQAETGGAFEAAPLFNNPVELHWAHEPLDCFAKDIPPHEPTRLDVCYAHEGYPTLRFFCDKRPRGVQSDFPPGRYKIRIRVRSEDGAICSRRFLVAFDGNFQSVYLEQLEG